MPSTKFDQEQTKKLYERLPERLRDALSSIELAEKVDEICQKYGLGDAGQVDIVYRLCGDVLVGILPPDDLEAAIQETKIAKSKLPPFMREINRYVFYPYKPELNQLYSVKPRDSEQESYIVEPQVETKKEQPAPKEKPELFPEEPKRISPDVYRESFEE